jgi:hypothetical protein
MFNIEVKSYRYLRTAMVALLLGLGAAVVYHSLQAGAVLASVSAYYYTPAQAIFVGALIGLGACMIALKGTNEVEDAFLNLGGMFAAVVAVVPTSRGADYRTAVRACEQADSPALQDLDCPTVRTLAEATRANVENSTVALLFMGALALLAMVLFFALKDRRTPGAKFPWWAFVASLVVYGFVAGAFALSRAWFIDNAHYIAAVGLLVCIVVVAVANALRRDPERQETLNAVPGALVRSRDRYAWFARIMLGAAAVGIVLWLLDWISVFLLEIVVAAFFVVFWMMQTIERWGDEAPPAAGDREPDRPGEPVHVG